MVKSESEIALLRIAGRMSEKAINTVIDRLEIGMPLDEIGRIHAVAMAQQGGQSEWIIANIRGLATGVVEPNELMKLDSVGSYKQYRGDVGRSVYFGEPTAEMLSRSDAVGRRPEARRGGKECVSPWRSGWWPSHIKKKKKQTNN